MTPWPLSAVATELLLQARQPPGVALTLKELVLEGAWLLRRGTVGPYLVPGPVPAPTRVPLPRLDRWLRARVPAHEDLRVLGRGLAGDRPLGQDLLRLATDDLVARGLLVVEPRLLLRPRVRRTADGDALRGELARRRAAWRDALAAGGGTADEALEELGRCPGLVVLLDRRVLQDVDRALRARTAGSDGSGTPGGDDARGVDWSRVDRRDGLDGAFDSVDSSVGDSGGGGDSGGDSGGDGGGGGGD